MASRSTAARSTRGGTSGSRRRPVDQARSSILATADRLFYRHGVRGVGIDTIADAAGVTKRTLYYHYPTKDALVAAYLEARDVATRIAIETAVAGQAVPGDRILGVFDYLAKWASTDDYHGCPFNNVVAEQGGDEASVIAKRHKQAFASWLADQAQLGGAVAPKQLGAELLVLVDGALNGGAIFKSPQAARSARRVAAMLLSAAGVAVTSASEDAG